MIVPGQIQGSRDSPAGELTLSSMFMTKSLTPIVAFVDIDGAPQATSDRHSRLASLLESLAGERITLVFSSHRTRAEIETIRQAIGVFHPFICESGAAAFVPGR